MFQINTLKTYLQEVNILTQVKSCMLGWMFSHGNHNVGDKIINGDLKIIFLVTA